MTSLRKRSKYSSSMGYRKQKGLIAIFVTIAFLFLAGIATFAIDINHAYMNKSKLQNAVDSAALAAAKIINAENSVSNGDTTVTTTLSNILAAKGNTELTDITSATYLNITYSDDPTDGDSFVDAVTYSSTSDFIYVRVAISGYPISNFIISVFGIDKYVSASAVAGPSAPTTPNSIVPIAICGDEDDPSSLSAFEGGKIYAVKSNISSLGPGNFQFLAFDGDTGADELSEALAGGFNGGLKVGDYVDTEPGGNTNKAINGINSRLGTQKNDDPESDFYPPDKYVKEPAELATLDDEGNAVYYPDDPENGWYYSDYEDELTACLSGDAGCNTSYYNASGALNRRTMVVPVVNCNDVEPINGNATVQVATFACFFLLQSMDKIQDELAMFGEFISECPPVPGGDYDLDNGTLYRIVLFNDPLSEAS